MNDDIDVALVLRQYCCEVNIYAIQAAVAVLYY